MDTELIQAIGRVIERLSIIWFAGFSLWCGWRLFYRTVNEPDHQAEFAFKSFVVKLQRVAPGIFFAVFGCVVLSLGLRAPLTLDRKCEGGNCETRTSYATGTTSEEALKRLSALNLIVRLANTSTDMQLAQADRAELRSRGETLDQIRMETIRVIAGADKLRTWVDYRERFRRDPETVPLQHRSAVEEIENLMVRR